MVSGMLIIVILAIFIPLYSRCAYIVWCGWVSVIHCYLYGSHSQAILNCIIDHSAFMLPNFMESVNCNNSKDFNFLASCGDRWTGRKRPYSSLVWVVRNIPCFLFCSSEEAARLYLATLKFMH